MKVKVIMVSEGKHLEDEINLWLNLWFKSINKPIKIISASSVMCGYWLVHTIYYE